MLYIAADHAGYPLKEELKRYLIAQEYEVEDLGNTELEPDDDYPDFAVMMAKKIKETADAGGILICGTGQGMCMVANRFSGIRAAFVYNEFTARDAAEHLNANIICLGGRTTDAETAKKLLRIWLDTEFSGEERHVRRLEKIEKFSE